MVHSGMVFIKIFGRVKGMRRMVHSTTYLPLTVLRRPFLMALRTALAESHPVQGVSSKNSLGVGALTLASFSGNEMFRQVNLAHRVFRGNVDANGWRGG
jgi:hypothetical protein